MDDLGMKRRDRQPIKNPFDQASTPWPLRWAPVRRLALSWALPQSRWGKHATVQSRIIFQTHLDIARFPWVKHSLWWSDTWCLTKSPPAQKDPDNGDFFSPQLLCIWDKIKLMDHNSGFFLQGFYISHIVEFFRYNFGVKQIRRGPGARGDGQSWSSSPLKSCPANINVFPCKY